MFPVYGGKGLSCKAVHSWVEKLSQRFSKVANDAWPGHPVEITTEPTLQWVEMLIRADRGITVDSVATALWCSNGFSIQNNAWLCEVTESVNMVNAQRNEGSRENEPNESVLGTSVTVCRWRRRYTKQDCYWARIVDASLATRIKACFNAMETPKFTFNRKV
jgi:hypothetical protein